MDEVEPRKSLASDVQTQTDASVEIKTSVERKAEVDALKKSCGFWRRRKTGQALARVNCFGRRKRS
jgi:hypothetical protein